MKLTYIGYSEEMMRRLIESVQFELVSIITRADVLSYEMRKNITDQAIHLYELKKTEGVSRIEEHIVTDKVLIYKFGYIIPKDIISRHDFYNIHPGSIETNRGAHPLRWTILLGERKTWMTLYQITGIDEGNVICEEEIDADGSDYVQLDQKMDQRLGLILDRFGSFLEHGGTGSIVLKEKGAYRHKVQEKDYIIDMIHDSLEVMDRKIRAVKDFGGAVVILQNIKYRAREIVVRTENHTNKRERETIPVAFERDGKKYILICEDYRWKS